MKNNKADCHLTFLQQYFIPEDGRVTYLRHSEENGNHGFTIQAKLTSRMKVTDKLL